MRLLNRAALAIVLVLPLLGLTHRVAAQKVEPCALITKAEAARILGKPAIAKAKSVPSGDGTCAYAGAGFEVHTEELQSPASWTGSMREMIEEKRAERVDRIGDEAVVFVDSNRDYAAASRKGKRIVTVTMYKDQSTLVDAKPVLVELLTRAMSRVH
jgi:hypothetical protein